MNDKEKRYMKIGIAIVLAGLAAVFVLPALVTIAWNLVNLGIAMLVLAGMWFFVPSLLEAMATGAWKLKELIWKMDPPTKLWRDLAEFGEEIESMETDIAEADGAKESMRQLYMQSKDSLSPDQRMMWQENLDAAQAGVDYLITERDNFRVEYTKMKQICQQEEANWKLALAQGKVVKTLQKAGNMAAGTAGGRVSIQEIHDRLAKNRAALNVIKSRKQIKIVDGKVVDVEAKPAAALTHNPSPVIENSSLAKPVAVPVSAAPAANTHWDNKLNNL